jgi:competence protein ComEC
MNDKIVRMRLMVLCVLFVSAIGIWLFPQSTASSTSPHLQVHFLDVGQGDAALIETPTGVQVLVDGGRDSSVLQELGGVMGIGDRKIDMVIGTHPDTDHIGGLIDVLKNYEVATILTTENKGDSQTAKLYEELKSAEGAEIVYARRGQTFTLDASTTLHVLFPETDPSDLESNTSSIVFQLEYGSSTFMFTGDSPKSIEEYLVLSEGEHLYSDVLKVGHHGSRTSTSEMFLDEVAPAIAVISAGKDNSYGHPHLEVTDALFNAGVTIFETAVEGTITLASDGVRVWKE